MPVANLEVEALELEARRAEAQAKIDEVSKGKKRTLVDNPLSLLIVGGIVTLCGNFGVAWYNGISSRAQESDKAQNELQVEREKAKSTLVLQAIASNDPAAAKRNIEFFVKAGLIADADGKILEAAKAYSPVLPSVGSAGLASIEADVDYSGKFWSATILPSAVKRVDFEIDRIVAGKDHFQTVGSATNVPWYIVGIIWTLEDGSASFSRHLNGDPLTARTIHVPRGLPVNGQPPFTWEESAIAFFRYDPRFSGVVGSDISKALNIIEGYNGLGYRRHGVNSPYLWGGTSEYSSGAYGEYAVWDARRVVSTIGAVALLRRMNERGVIHLDKTSRISL